MINHWIGGSLFPQRWRRTEKLAVGLVLVFDAAVSEAEELASRLVVHPIEDLNLRESEVFLGLYETNSIHRVSIYGRSHVGRGTGLTSARAPGLVFGRRWGFSVAAA